MPNHLLKKLSKKIYYKARLDRVFDPKKHEHIGPWNISLSDRIAKLKDAQNNRRKIAFIVFVDKSHTFRYRCYNIFQIMNKSETWSVLYFSLDEYKTIKNNITSCDLLILQRTPYDHHIQKIVELSKKHNIPVVFDIDDLFFHKNLGNYSAEYQKTARIVDAFIVTNDFLGEKITKKFNKPFYIIPNFINQEQYDISKKEYRQNISSSDDFVIGYFSGSPTHQKDFKLIESDILRFLDDFPNTKLYIVGYMDLSERAKKYIQQQRIKMLRPVDFVQLQQLIAKVNVNIAPLVNNEFNNCKSELKFFEAAIVGTITVASPTYTFKNSIKNRETGFLCDDDQWYDTIKYIYNHQQDMVEIAKAAKKYCIDNYYGKKIIQKIEGVYNDIIKKN